MSEMPEKCSCCGHNLDRFIQPVILSILAETPRTGYAVIKKIPAYVTFRDTAPDPTGVYRYLKIMEGRGLIGRIAADAEGKTEQYALTEEGRACLEKWRETLVDYAGRIRSLADELAVGL